MKSPFSAWKFDRKFSDSEHCPDKLKIKRIFLVLEIEFNAFSHGKWEITELQFAEMLLRYSDVWDMESQLKVSFQKYIS